MRISIPEVAKIERVTHIDSDGTGFYAWIMFDNHTFARTLPGTKEEVCKQVRAVHDGDRSMFAMYSLHHESLDKETKLVHGFARDMGKMLQPETWGKTHNPLTD